MAEPVSVPASIPASSPGSSLTPPQNPTPAAPALDPGIGAKAKEGSSKPDASDLFDVKVNGKLIKMTRQEMHDHASMSYAAESKFKEAKETRKEIDRIINNAKTNPIESLMDPALGLTKDQVRDAFEKWYAKEYIEPETLNADQKRVRELEAKFKKIEEDEKRKKQEDDKTAQEKMTAQQRDHLQKQIIEAIDKSGLPKTKKIASRVALYMRQNNLNGWDAPIDMIIRQVKNERQAEMADEIKEANVDQLIELFGEEGINKIRQYDLQRLREKRKLGGMANPTPGAANTEGPISYREVNQRLRDMRTGKS